MADEQYEADVRAAFDAAISARHLTAAARWSPLAHQVPPAGDWAGWLLMAGRGAGKTDACARYITEHVKGPPCLPGPIPHWIGIIAPTLGDAATSCYAGPSGLRAHDPDAKLVSIPGGITIRWPNGSEAKLFGAHEPEDVERLRAGGNRCLVWLEELAAWRYLDKCFEQMQFGLRTGPKPRWVGSTTPKPRLMIKRLMKGEVRNVTLTRATTFDNPHLPQEIREALEDAYGARQMGRQELYGDLIEADEAALWTREALERNRWHDDLPDLSKITVGVDPSGGAGEQGIVIVGKETRRVITGGKIKNELHGYVLGDYTVCLSPAGWGRRTVQAAIDFEADDICVETNFGGDMAMATITGAAESMGIGIPVRKLTASRGKRVRAEPVAALSERDRWHHVGFFEQLEDQQCTWTEDAGYSPDRLDAAVWPGWHLKLVSVIARGTGSFGGSTMANQKVG
jgi:phage terminase large subunit-like protein